MYIIGGVLSVHHNITPRPPCPVVSLDVLEPPMAVAGSPGPGSSPPRPRYRGILLRHRMDVWEFVHPMLRYCMDVWESARREVLYCRSRAVPRLGRIRMLRYRMDVWESVSRDIHSMHADRGFGARPLRHCMAVWESVHPMLRHCMDVWEFVLRLVVLSLVVREFVCVR
jgi:hypothetical protein